MASMDPHPPSVSRMDRRTVQDLDKCFCRVITHLQDKENAKRRDKKGTKIENASSSPDPSPKALMEEVLPLALYFLDLRPLVSLPPGSSSSSPSPLGLMPLRVDRADEVTPSQRDRMRMLSLDLLSALVSALDRVDAFHLWMVFLPGCSHSPYALSLADKLSPRREDGGFEDPACKARLASVVGAYVDKIGPFLRFVERPSASLGFTPLYQSLGECLVNSHRCLVDYVRSVAAPNSETSSSASSGGGGGSVTGAVKTLTLLLKNCPYRKLGFEPLKEVYSLAASLLKRENPVVKIAGLNLHLAVVMVCHEGNAGKGSEVVSLKEGCSAYISLSLPSRGLTDNNVRYVSLQNLGHLTFKHVGALSQNMDSLSAMVSANLSDPDAAIVLHTLRMCKWVAKHDPSKEEETTGDAHSTANGDTSSASPFSPLWNLLLRSRAFQAVESRADPNLEALLCDIVSELGEATFARLAMEQRVLCVSYVLCRCRKDQEQDGRGGGGGGGGGGITQVRNCFQNSVVCVDYALRSFKYCPPFPQVRSSAFRALGMLLCFGGLRDDVSFLSDCTDVIADALQMPSSQQRSSSATSRSEWRASVTCATWALASLSEAFLEARRAEKEEDKNDFPRVHVLGLLAIIGSSPALAPPSSSSSSQSSGSNVIAQVNLYRSTGALLQCLDESFLSADEESNAEVFQAVDNVLQFVLRGIRGAGGMMMKVRWNACHAAGKIFQVIISNEDLLVWEML